MPSTFTIKTYGPDGKLVKSTPAVSTFPLKLAMTGGLSDVDLCSPEVLITFATCGDFVSY